MTDWIGNQALCPRPNKMFVEAIFITSAAGAPMLRVRQVRAMVGRGLDGDRYALGTGYYSARDGCEVTLIEGEALDRMASHHGVQVREGQHRRNLVTRGVALRQLHGKRLHMGDVVLEYERPRPPCDYVQRLTEPNMTRALAEGAGIAMRVCVPGLLWEGMQISIVPVSGARAARRLP